MIEVLKSDTSTAHDSNQGGGGGVLATLGLLAFGLVPFVLGNIALWAACYEVAMVSVAADWPARSARITKMKLESDEGSWTAEIEGVFLDDNTSFKTERMSYGGGQGVPGGRVRGFEKKFAVGTRHDVYASPGDSRSVILFKPELSWFYLLLVGSVGLVFSLVGAGVLFAACRVALAGPGGTLTPRSAREGAGK